MFKIAPLAEVICIKLIKTSVTSSVVDFYKDIPGNSTHNTCIKHQTDNYTSV